MCERLLQDAAVRAGQFDDPEGFKRLAAVLDELDGRARAATGMFYLATPPSQFEVLVRQLGDAGLARRGASDGEHAPPATPGPAGRAIVIEKPFGRDLRDRARARRA